MYARGGGYSAGYKYYDYTPRMSFEQQKRHVEKLLKKSGAPKPGQTWYAIDADWYLRFNESDEQPGRIDNSALWDREREGLKLDAEEKADFELLPFEVHKFLDMYYRPSPVLKFQVKKDEAETPVIDLYPAYFEVSVEEAEKVPDVEDGETDENEETDKLTDEPVENVEEEIKPESETVEQDAEVVENEEEEEVATEEKLKTKKTRILKMSRYSKLGKLKGSIARLLELRPQQLTIFVQEAGGEEAGFKALDELSEKELSMQIHETLPDIAKIVWKIKCIKREIDENAFKAHEAFSRTEPRVGQRVDAKMHNRWLEAEIVEVIEVKPTTGSEKPVTKVKVHYRSFDSSKDKIFDVMSEDIDEAYANLADWRQQTRKGIKVEIKKSIFSPSNEWVMAEIVKIDRKGVSSLKSQYAKQLAARDNKKTEKPIFSRIKGFFTKSKPKDVNKSKSSRTRDRSDTVDSDDLEISYSGLIQVAIKKSLYAYPRDADIYVVDLGSEEVAVAGTHLQKAKSKFASLMSKDVSKKPKAAGAVGLRNIGNTCYMNSILQCLMATEPMTKYFLSGEYKKDINRKNVIGFGGRVAVAYGELAETYFSNKFSIIAPSNFKRVFGGCCTTFAGTAQQDSQEFLTQLLDALHEDLNKVLTKPIVEAPDSDGRPDAELARISWDNHLARNKSLFVDHMFGLLKSHLICPNEKCKNEATKFDPFSNLVLPIPAKEEYIINIVFVTLEPKRVRVTIKAEEKTKEEYHEIVDDDYEPTDDEDIRLTRHFRFHYLVKEDGRLYGTQCATWLADKMGISPENVSLFSFSGLNLLKCIQDPLSDQKYFVRANDRTNLMAFENNTIDFPLLQTLYNIKVRAEQKLPGVLDKKIESETAVPNNEEEKVKGTEDVKAITEDSEGKTAVTVGIAKEEEQPLEDGMKAVIEDQVNNKEPKVKTKKTEVVVSTEKTKKPIAEKPSTDKLEKKLDKGQVKVKANKKKPDKKIEKAKNGRKGKSKKQKQAEIAKAKLKAKKERKKEKRKTGSKKSAKPKASSKEKASKLKRKDKQKDAKNTVDEAEPEKTEKTFVVDEKESEQPEVEEEDFSEEEEEDEERYVKLIFEFKKLGVSHYAATVKHQEAFLFDAEKTSYADIIKEAWLRSMGLLNLDHPKLKLEKMPEDPEEAQMALAMKALKIMYNGKELTPDKKAFLKLKKAKYPFQQAATRIIRVYLRTTDMFKKEIKGSVVSTTSYYYKKTTVEDMDKKLNVGFVAHTPSIRELAREKEVVTLEKCFKALNTPEKLLNERDWWYCNKCKKHVPATKKMDVFSAGDILIIVLKRFKAGAALIRRKIEEPVYFPLKDLDLSEYIQNSEQSKIYDLYAVSYHSGGLGGGHYTAKALVGEQWFTFNDSSVQPCTEESVVNRYAYVLFYRRKDAL